MNFASAFYFSILEKRAFKRACHHFSIYYIVETGELHTGYNNEVYFPLTVDMLASDWELV